MLLASLWLACDAAPPKGDAPPEAPPGAEAPVQIVALSFPAQWLTQRLVGEGVVVERLLPVGEDPPSYQPPPERIAALQDADLIVGNGAGYEAWLTTASLPDSRLVLTAAGLDLITLPETRHRHGAAGEHSHGGLDPHTWMDPLLLIQQADALIEALGRVQPRGGFEERGTVLKGELGALHVALQAGLAPLSGRRIAANHPAYNYLARRYGLDLTSFQFDPETPPTAESLAAFDAWATGQAAPMLWWEQAPTEAVRAAFPATVRHVVIDPLEQPPEGGEYDLLRAAQGNLGVLSGI
jgi:zinc transport system substrate-binding protein